MWNVDVGLGAYKAVPQLLIGKILGASNRGSQAHKKFSKRTLYTCLRSKYVFKVSIGIYGLNTYLRSKNTSTRRPQVYILKTQSL